MNALPAGKVGSATGRPTALDNGDRWLNSKNRSTRLRGKNRSQQPKERKEKGKRVKGPESRGKSEAGPGERTMH